MLDGSGYQILTERLFWAASALVVYAYVGYPILMFLMARFMARPIVSQDFAPPVTIILAVHNGEMAIRKKLENLLAQDYPRERVHILVVSDASTDATERIAAEFQNAGVRLHVMEKRLGKHHAQQAGIALTDSEILVFTDASPLLARDAIRQLLRKFADPQVGCAGGEDRIESEAGETSRERSYIDYDMLLRRWESLAGSCVGVSGAFFAARRGLCEPWWPDRSSDFMVALQAVRRGYRTISDPEAVHYYKAAQSPSAEYKRKKRTAINGLIVLFHSLGLLNVFRYGLFSWQLFSHKLCRWLVPFALFALLLLSLYLAPTSPWYLGVLAVQVLFYALAAVGLARGSRLKLLQIPAFFTMANAAILVAWFECATGDTSSIWDPTIRP